MPAILLRVGICACATPYYGKLNGYEFTIKSLHGIRLENPLLFRIEEVILPEDLKEWQAYMTTKRIHFRVDLHREGGLSFGVVMKHTVKPTLPDFKELSGVTNILRDVEVWYRRRFPAVPTIQRGVKTLIERMWAKQLENWLRTMNTNPSL